MGFCGVWSHWGSWSESTKCKPYGQSVVKERFRVCQVDGIPKNNCVGFDKQTLSMTGTQFYNLKNYGLKCSMPTARIEPKRLDIAQGEQGSLRCLTEGKL